MPHALISCPTDRWPALALFLDSCDLPFQLLDDLPPEEASRRGAA